MIVKRREQPSRRSNMAEFTLSQVVEATQGTSAHTDNIKFLDVSTDTRTIESGFLFVALKVIPLTVMILSTRPLKRALQVQS